MYMAIKVFSCFHRCMLSMRNISILKVIDLETYPDIGLHILEKCNVGL